MKHEFALTGLVHCGHCGCLMVGELKKQRYVYYHCTGNRGRCGEPYVREERLEDEFARRLQAARDRAGDTGVAGAHGGRVGPVAADDHGAAHRGA